LIFDSRLESVPSGARSGSRSPRRIVHRAGKWTVDFELQPEAGNRLSLAGQVLATGKKKVEMGSLNIALISEGKLLAHTSTNRFGEFELEFGRSGQAQVYIEVPGRRLITLSLPESVWEKLP
jgi:hypothetical protein